MNTENLNGILAQYIQYCKTGTAAEEGTVWRAADCFGVNWDIEDSDFPGMFADAMQQAQQALDNPALQPVGGLQELMLRDAEVELVRECFRWLFKEDDGDITKRRGRAELFADQINGRFRRVFPRMPKYTMNTANAVFFLNLWEPHDNYFYNAAEARAWAEYFDNEADFGGVGRGRAVRVQPPGLRDRRAVQRGIADLAARCGGERHIEREGSLPLAARQCQPDRVGAEKRLRRAVPPDSIVNGIGTLLAVAPERSRAMYCGRRSSPCDVTPRHSAKRILSVKSAASSAESPAARQSETEKSRSAAVSMRSLIREPPLRRRARAPHRGRAGALRADTAPAFPSRWRPAAPCARRPPPSAVSRGRRERCCQS